MFMGNWPNQLWKVNMDYSWCFKKKDEGKTDFFPLLYRPPQPCQMNEIKRSAGRDEGKVKSISSAFMWRKLTKTKSEILSL